MMSIHRIPLTELERAGLINYGLAVGKPSQLSDARNGGDFNFNGKFIGHDVQCREMILSINGSDLEVIK